MVPGFPQRADDHPCVPTTRPPHQKQRDQWLRRRLLQRQLHDGAALRISALTLRLGLLQHHSLPGGQTVRNCVSEIQDELHMVLEELRAVAAEIYPPLLDEAGLGPALREVADRLRQPLTVEASGERFGPAAEGAAYFAVARCLAARPAGAPSMTMRVWREDNNLMLSVSGSEPSLAELVDEQASPLGGAVEIGPGPLPGASTIIARIPCE
ncbi:MAG TPA: histidine kinase [Pseudonocardiaceae bacterium]|nr:histidine kinase [Pseudonocardiaceae bacterium]